MRIDVATIFAPALLLFTFVSEIEVRRLELGRKKAHFSDTAFATQPHDALDLKTLEKAMEHLVDPVTGSPPLNRQVIGVLCLHVDDLFMAGNAEFHQRVVEGLRRDFQVGSEDK